MDAKYIVIWAVAIFFIAFLFVWVYRFLSKPSVHRGRSFGNVKQSLWDLFYRSRDGSSLLVIEENSKIILQFILIASKKRFVKFVYPLNETTKAEVEILRNALDSFHVEYENTPVAGVDKILFVDSDEFLTLCNLARDIIKGLSFDSSSTFTITYRNYAIDPNLKFEALKYKNDIEEAMQISL